MHCISAFLDFEFSKKIEPFKIFYFQQMGKVVDRLMQSLVAYRC